MDCLEKRLEIGNEGLSFSVGFHRIDNRFGHDIRVDQNGQSFSLVTDNRLESSWPPCPAIQDIHFEDRGDSKLLFGVGMSGQTHYSVSIEARSVEAPKTNTSAQQLIRFEFAAHAKDEPEFLGTTYLIQGSNKLDLDEFCSVSEGSKMATIDSENGQLICIEPETGRPAVIPGTALWGFELRF